MFTYDISVNLIARTNKKRNDLRDILNFVKERNLPITKIEPYTRPSYIVYAGYHKNELYKSIVLVDKDKPFECLILFKKKPAKMSSKIIEEMINLHEILIFCDEEYKEFYKYLITNYHINFFQGCKFNNPETFFFLLNRTRAGQKYYDFIQKKILPYYATDLFISKEQFFLELFSQFSDEVAKQQLLFLSYLIHIVNSNQILDFEKTRLGGRFIKHILKSITLLITTPNVPGDLNIIRVLDYILILILNERLIIDLARKNNAVINNLKQLSKRIDIPEYFKQNISLVIVKAMENSSVVNNMLLN